MSKIEERKDLIGLGAAKKNYLYKAKKIKIAANPRPRSRTATWPTCTLHIVETWSTHECQQL